MERKEAVGPRQWWLLWR